MYDNNKDDNLVEAVHEFDRLMAAHDDDTRHFIAADDDVKFAKTDVDSDDAERNGIELVQLPVPPDTATSKQRTAW